MRVILAVDGSDASRAAVQATAARPWPAGSILRVLSVAQPPVPASELAVVATAAYEEATAEATQHVSAAAAALGPSGPAVQTSVRQGDPGREIVDDAREWGADLVIVGSHGRTGMKRLIMGSVAEHVARHAPCSVEVARAGAAGLSAAVSGPMLGVRSYRRGAVPGGEPMPAGRCETCGNMYDKPFQVTMGGTSHTFDSFECAIEALAPRCAHCGLRVVGHGVEKDERIFCCASCASAEGVAELRDRA